MQRARAIVLRQWYLYRGSPARFLPLFVWVAIDIVLWGFITRYLNSFASTGFSFVPTLLGAVLLWDFFTRVLHGVTTAFLEDVWSRNFLNLFATPLLISEYLAGLVITSISTSVIGLVIMLILATSAFGLNFFIYGAMVIPFLLVLFLVGIAFGIAAAALLLRLGPAAEWLIWPIPAMLSPFAGVFYPLSTLPHWMQGIAKFLPPSHVFEGLRAIVTGHPVPEFSLAAGGSLALVYLALAGWFFSSTYHHVVRSGLIARYAAETVA